MTTCPLWLAAESLLLASGSATRRDMLRAVGIPLEIVRPEVDERAIERDALSEGVAPEAMAEALARAKALAVSRERPGRLVLGADQILLCGERSFHKAEDLEAAAAQLSALSGRRHSLHSAFALALDGAVVSEGRSIARLTMRPFVPDLIARYLEAVGEAALSSVGCYQIEGVGAQLFEAVEGDHFTILGLPLFPLLAALRARGCLAS